MNMARDEGNRSIGLRRVTSPQVILVLLMLCIALPATAGKYPYAEFKDVVSIETKKILKKHGMPVDDRDFRKQATFPNPWFAMSGVLGSYTVWLFQSDEIPQQAVLDIVKLCLDFYEQRGRKERFRIVMYKESEEEWRKSLFLGIGALAGVKPFFELTIGRNEQ
jgi:hypothetical protein